LDIRVPIPSGSPRELGHSESQPREGPLTMSLERTRKRDDGGIEEMYESADLPSRFASPSTGRMSSSFLSSA